MNERANDSYTLYLRDLAQHPLISPEREIQLAGRIKRGDLKAREEMIQANLRLVVKIAREYENYGVPLLDLINEGNMGLMKAAGRFDPVKGAKFSTYASFWIKQSIRRALDNGARTIRIPSHLVHALYELKRAKSRLSDKLGREPTNGELMQKLSISMSQLKSIRASVIPMIPLDAPLGDDEGTVSELIKDERAELPGEELVTSDLIRLIFEQFGMLNEREQVILKLRFGLGGGKALTLDETGEVFHLTRERIRQIQVIAFAKIRKGIEKKERVLAA